MPGWTLVDTHPTQGRTFQRPLDAFEHAFVWGTVCNGSTDSIHHFELRLLNGSQDAHLFSEANIQRAWLSTKRRFPLAGAKVQGESLGLGVASEVNTKMDGKGDPRTALPMDLCFVVQERGLSSLRPYEIVVGQVADAEDAQHKAVAILDGPRPLSDTLLAQLYIFREAKFESARADVLHVMVMLAHCVTDGTSNRTIMRCFLDTLARGGRPDSEPAQISLEDRLANAVAMVELDPIHVRSLSVARQRWRKAIAAVITQFRFTRMQGGQSLPWRLKRSTPYTPARSGSVNISLTRAESTTVIAKCRQHKLTFGTTYLVLAQVAMTRVLYRRYLRSEMTEEEWEYRKRQPYITAGPMNLRPYLDKAWFENGGGGEFVLSMSGYSYRLPFMTLGGTDKRGSKYREQRLSGEFLDAPQFSELLSFDRFLYRAGLIKRQAATYLGHPLFLELAQSFCGVYAEFQRFTALQWQQAVETAGDGNKSESENDEVLTIMNRPSVVAHGGSSLGNVDPIFPLEYPLPPNHPLSPYSPVSHPMKAGYIIPPSSPSLASDEVTTSTIGIEYFRTRLQAHPGQLYLGAATSGGQLNLYVFYDKNVYEEGVVTEWLDELKGAVLWYLG